MLLQRVPGLAGLSRPLGVARSVAAPRGDSLLYGLTLQADQCLERGDINGAALFIELIYDLFDFAAGETEMSDCEIDATRQLQEIGPE